MAIISNNIPDMFILLIHVQRQGPHRNWSEWHRRFEIHWRRRTLSIKEKAKEEFKKTQKTPKKGPERLPPLARQKSVLQPRLPLKRPWQLSMANVLDAAAGDCHDFDGVQPRCCCATKCPSPLSPIPYISWMLLMHSQ